MFRRTEASSLHSWVVRLAFFFYAMTIAALVALAATAEPVSPAAMADVSGASGARWAVVIVMLPAILLVCRRLLRPQRVRVRPAYMPARLDR